MKYCRDRFMPSVDIKTWELERLIAQQKKPTHSHATYSDLLCDALFGRNFSLRSRASQPCRYSLDLRRILDADGIEQLPLNSSPIASITSNLSQRNDFIVADEEGLYILSVTPDEDYELETLATSESIIPHLCPLTPQTVYLAEKTGMSWFLDSETGSMTPSRKLRQIISTKALNSVSLAVLQKTAAPSKIVFMDKRDPNISTEFTCSTATSFIPIKPFLLATGSSENICLWDLRNLRTPCLRKESDPITALILEENSIICSTSSSQLSSYSACSLEMTSNKQLSERIDALYPTNDGSFLSTSLSTKSVHIWEINNGCLDMQYQTNVGRSVAFGALSPDNKFFLGASRENQTIKLWRYSKPDHRPRSRQSLPTPPSRRYQPHSVLR